MMSSTSTVSFHQQGRTPCDNQTLTNTSVVCPPYLYTDCKQPTLQTSSRNDPLVWSGVGYSRSVATGGSARVATGKRRGGAGAAVARDRAVVRCVRGVRACARFAAGAMEQRRRGLRRGVRAVAAGPRL